MKKQLVSKLAFSAILATSLVLVGCGGGGGDGEEKITVTTDADWVAYQDSNGEWHVLSNVSTTEDGNEVTTYSFKAKNKYGVAFYCVDNEEGQVYQLTKDDLSSVSYFCEDHATRYTVSGTFANLDENSGGNVYIDSQSMMNMLSKSQVDNSWTVSYVPLGTWDIVGVEFTTDGDSITPTRAAIKRDVEVNKDVTGQELTFAPNSLVGYAFNVTDGDAQGYGISFFVTKNNTVVMNGNKDKDETSGKWYRIQNIELIDGDVYVFIGANSDESKIRMESVDASTPPEGGWDGWNMNLNDITPLTSGSFDPNTKTISGLNYNPTGKVTNLVGYDISIDNDVDWNFAISKSWLGDGTSYTLPDFSGLEGFNNSWWFDNLESTSVDVELTAVMSDASLSNLLQPEVEIVGSFPLLKSATFEMVTQELQ